MTEYVTMQQFKRFTRFILIVIAILCVWIMAVAVSGQELKAVPTSIFQEVVIEYKGQVYCFHREKVKEWGDWEQWPPYDNKVKVRKFKPRKADQKAVFGMIGFDRAGMLSEKVSGYYNFTDRQIHDWKEFGGYNYGTYSKRIE